MKKYLTLLLLLASDSFVSSFLHQQQRTQSHYILVLENRQTTSTASTTTIFGKSFDSDDEDDDDDESLALRAEDWRAFRAKLVMAEQKSAAASETKSETKSVPIEEDGDLDGIGSLFSDDFVSEESKSSASSSSVLTGMTPLDPSQFAYDSGDMIEQGSVILGG
jgi:hypothetical protein